MHAGSRSGRSFRVNPMPPWLAAMVVVLIVSIAVATPAAYLVKDINPGVEGVGSADVVYERLLESR